MSERRVPTINEGLSIPELIKIVKHSFLESEFIEVQNILMGREKNMKTEMENFVKERDSIKEEARLLERTLERTQSLVKLEKLKLEDKLQKSQRNCEELNQYIDELKNKNLESERLVEVYEDKVKCLDTRLEKMGEDNEDLRQEKLAANQTVEELRRKQFEADHVVEELKRQNLEVTQAVDELRLQKMESDKAAELYKSRLEDLEPRIKNLEFELANMLGVKEEDVAMLVDMIGKSVADGQHKGQGGKDSLGNDSTYANADAENVVVVSPRVSFTTNSTGSGGIGSPKKGGRNLVHSWTKDDGAKPVQTSPGSQSHLCPPHVECNGTAQDNEGEEPLVSGSRASSMRSDGGVAVEEKTVFGDVIEICDSDDETKPGVTTYVSNTSSGPTNKRNRTNLNTKTKRRIFISDDEDEIQIDAKENQILESTDDRTASLDHDISVKSIPETGLPQSTPPDGSYSLPSRREERNQKVLNNVDSDSGDESSTDTICINDLLAAARSRKRSRT